MNLPEIEMAVHVLRLLEVAVESRDLKSSKVIPISITENTGKIKTCIVMKCIVEYPKNTPRLSDQATTYDTSISLVYLT